MIVVALLWQDIVFIYIYLYINLNLLQSICCVSVQYVLAFTQKI